MTGGARDDLWQRLVAEGIARGEPPEAGEPASPWPVRLMLGAAGWIGALFLLGFVAVMLEFVFRADGAALPVGAICCAGAYLIFRSAPRNEFVGQFGFATSLAGQAMMAFGLFSLAGWRTPTVAFFSLAVIQTVLAVVLPNVVHRTWATLTAIAALHLGCAAVGAFGLATVVAATGAALIGLNEAALARRASFWRPIGYGFAIALLHLDLALIWGRELQGLLWSQTATPPPPWVFWIGPAVTGALFVYTAARLLARLAVPRASAAGATVLAVAGMMALFGLAAPGICAGVLVLVLGFAGGNRVLMGLGLLATGGYLSHYYYQLDLTLLAKAAVLAGTGVVLLLARSAVARWLPAPEAPRA